MRIAFLCRTFLSANPGGMERHAQWLAASLREAGEETYVLAARPLGQASPQGQAANTILIDAPADRWSAAWEAGTELEVRRLRPDLVVSESTSSNHLTTQWPVVTHLHGNHWNELTGAWQTWGRRRARVAARRSLQLFADYLRWRPRRIALGHVIALTDREARLAHTLYGISPDRLTVIGNPVSKRFGGQGTPKTRTIVYGGRLDPSKGVRTLVEAFCASGVHEAGYRLCIAGEGPERDALDCLAARRHGGERIAFRGALGPISFADLLSSAEIACFPSLRRESFSLGVLEAMASGCAIVASRAAGVDDISSHRMNPAPSLPIARVVQRGRATEWATALQELTSLPAERQRLADTARHVSEGFDESKVLAEIREVYRRAASESLPSSRGIAGHQ